MENISEAAIEARARRAAKRCGWVLKKSSIQKPTIDDQGKLMIIDPYTTSVVAGEKFNLDARDAFVFCRQAELRWAAEKHKQKG
jgi:hypothetical protein